MTVCALSSSEVFRLGPEGAFSLPITEVAAARVVAGGVQIDGPWKPTPTGLDGRPQSTGTQSVLCGFAPEDGGDRFAGMLSAAAKTQKGQPPP